MYLGDSVCTLAWMPFAYVLGVADSAGIWELGLPGKKRQMLKDHACRHAVETVENACVYHRDLMLFPISFLEAFCRLERAVFPASFFLPPVGAAPSRLAVAAALQR